MILEAIVAKTWTRVCESKAAYPEEALLRRLEAAPPPRDIAARLRGPGVSIVAEVKRASPSKGPLNCALRPERLAVDYVTAGADAISVLTEPYYFRGSGRDLEDVRAGLAGVGLERPLLRKDFVVDSYQLLESRVWGADAVLLIAAVLDDTTLARLYAAACALGLTPLVEVHTEAELARVLPLKPALVGINNRNLRDFTTDIAVTRRLRPLVPEGCVVVSESGITSPEHMRELARLGVDAALIGEALVTARDPIGQLRLLKEAGRSPMTPDDYR